MLKTKSSLEVKIGEKMYSFQCESDSPLGACFDAICQMHSFIIEKINESKKIENSDLPRDETKV